MGGSAGAGARSSVLGYLVRLGRRFCSSSLILSKCLMALVQWCPVSDLRHVLQLVAQ